MLLSTYVAAQTKYSNDFLNLGAGAKGLSLANTQVAVVNDVTSSYWNPAGIANVEKKYEILLMHAAYYADIANYDYMGLSYRIDEKQSIGFTLLRLGVDGIPNTTQLIDNQGNINYDRITYFSVADWAALFTYGRQLPIENLTLGVNFKLIKRKIGSFAGAWGFGLDAGLQYEIKKWKLGLLARDITSTFNAWSYQLTDEMKNVFDATNNEIPTNGLEVTLPRLSFGFGRNFELGKGFTTMATMDIDMPFDGKRNSLLSTKTVSFEPHVGIEFGYKDFVFIRSGLGNLQKEKNIEGKEVFSCQVNIGLGFTIKKILSIDYAFTDLGDMSVAIYSHVFSLKLALDYFKKPTS
ncbi:MAG: PorV/PorQ family protein [Bacteroidales bacterium]|nr:PorV/PorQ family protein [Bacteroidales bacterium]